MMICLIILKIILIPTQHHSFKMATLGDAFPDSFKEGFSDRSLKAGSILRLHVKDTTPPKIKIFIIIGEDEDSISLACLYINSDINYRMNFSQELIALQMPLKSKDFDWLHHDSFLDCSKIHPQKKSEIRKILQNRPDAYIGDLDEENFNIILETVKSSTTIKGKVKKKFGLYNRN